MKFNHRLDLDIGLKEYKLLEIKARTEMKWFWPAPWYVVPFALPLDDWEEFYKFVSKEFPVQSFFRVKVARKISSLIYRWELNYWIPIRDFLKPRNKELKKLIPRGHEFNSTIIRNVLYKIHELHFTDELISCWEEDKGTKWVEIAKQAREIKGWIQVGRFELEKKSETLWREFNEERKFSRQKYWELIEELNKEIDKGDSKCLTWIVENREIYD